MILGDGTTLGPDPEATVKMTGMRKVSALLFGGQESIATVELTEGKGRDYLARQDTLVKPEHGLSAERLVAVVYDVSGRAYYSHGLLRRLWWLGWIR